MVSKSREEEGSESTGKHNSWDELIERLITQIEMVSSHFGYTEEYVLEHTPAWISRKFLQAQREKFEEHQRKVFSGFQSLLLLLDATFNKGKDFDKIIPPSLEDAKEIEIQRERARETFINSQWWKH